MILGHAPIVVPAILGLSLGWYPIAYLPLAVLQLSVGLRVVGDLAPGPDLRMLGGLWRRSPSCWRRSPRGRW